LTYAKQTNHHETKKKEKTKKRNKKLKMSSTLTLGLKGDLTNKTKALTKEEKLESDNEKH